MRINNLNNPSKIDFQQRFDSIAKNYDNISNQYTVKRRAESLKLESANLILEVGSGSGIITKSFDCDVICSDFSFEMCKQAKKTTSLVVCCDAETLPFRDKVFDGIISAEMIYFLKNPQKFINSSHNILKKNGKLMIEATNQKMNFVDKIRSTLRKIGFHRMYFDDGLRNFMEVEFIESLLKKNNFLINSIEKQIVLPFASMDKLNRIIEKSFLNRFCIFFIIKATAK